MGIVKASLEILAIGIGVKKVVLLMSDRKHLFGDFQGQQLEQKDTRKGMKMGKREN